MSFSIDTKSTNVLHLGNASFAQIKGFMNTRQQMYKTVVEDWLWHKDFTNLELTAISNWHADETIKEFLAESTLQVTAIFKMTVIIKAKGSASICACQAAPRKRVEEAVRASRSPPPLRVSFRTRIQGAVLHNVTAKPVSTL